MELEAKLALTNFKLSKNFGYVYDAAWALAVGLNNTINHLNDSGLKHYTYDPYYIDAIIEGMNEVNFAGISVSYLFYFNLNNRATSR